MYVETFYGRHTALEEIHRDQAIVERFNRTLAERLFGCQYAISALGNLLAHSLLRIREWARTLPEVIKALNAETKNPPPIVTRKVDDASVSYLYQPGELEDGGRRHATDPIWSVDIPKIDYHIITQDIRVYYLKAPAPKRGFVKEELLIVPADTNTQTHVTIPSGAVHLLVSSSESVVLVTVSSYMLWCHCT